MYFFNLNKFNVRSLRKLMTLTFILSCTFLSSKAQAATIIVDSLDGSSGGTNCSLADAIISANTGTASASCLSGSIGSDEIIFDNNLNNSTILLTADLPEITDDLIITGPPIIDQVTISGDDTYSIFIVDGVELNSKNLKLTNGLGKAVALFGSPNNGGAVAALSGAIVTLKRCILSNNHASNRGGAIYAEFSSSVKLVRCAVSNNSSALDGGAISGSYTAHIDIVNSSFTNNSTTAPTSYGGAITLSSYQSQVATLNIRNSIFSNNSAYNRGGAIMLNYNAVADITESTFSDNSAIYYGGAVNIQSGASASISKSSFSSNNVNYQGGAVAVQSNSGANVLNCTFSNNSAQKGGAIYSYSAIVNLNTVFVSGNQAQRGGAIYVSKHPSLPSGNVQLTRSFLSNNSASNVGGAVAIESGAFMTINDSTLSNNLATIRGGAMSIDESIVELVNSTVSSNNTGNEGGTVYINNAASVKVYNTTLAENIGGSIFTFNSSITVLENTVLAGGHCDNDSSSSVILNGGVHIDDGTCGATSIGPSQLGPLAFNGTGPIPTHLPIPGSPLVDHGVGGTASNPATDQRGHARIVGIAVDIGSVELQDPEDI